VRTLRKTLSRQDQTPAFPEAEIDGRKVKQLVDVLEGGLEEALDRIAAEFVPERGKLETQVKAHAQKAPLHYLFPVAIKDYLGQTVALIGSAEADLEGRTVHEMSQHLYFFSPFLHAVLEGLVARYSPTPDDLTAHVYQSPAFREEQKPLLQRGFQLYLDQDAIATTHVLVPQIESAFRTLLEKAGRPVMKYARWGGGFDYRPLDDLLRDPAAEAILGQDLTFYLRVLLTDRRGWNARNHTLSWNPPCE
jgi:hypothetical protein